MLGVLRFRNSFPDRVNEAAAEVERLLAQLVQGSDHRLRKFLSVQVPESGSGEFVTPKQCAHALIEQNRGQDHQKQRDCRIPNVVPT